MKLEEKRERILSSIGLGGVVRLIGLFFYSIFPYFCLQGIDNKTYNQPQFR